MKTCIHTFLILLCGLSFLSAQPGKTAPEVIDSGLANLTLKGTLPPILKEASGLEITGTGHLWSHNDDRFSILYCMDTLGNTLKTIHLNQPNLGWEDLAQDEKGNLYLGGFGNNKNERKNLAIYKIENPESFSGKVYTAGQIQYHYPDQYGFPPRKAHLNFDADAFVSRGDSLYLFTKNRTDPFTGFTKVYRLPQEPGNYEAVLYDSLYLGPGPMMDAWVTSADLSPDGNCLVLLSHECIWIITRFGKQRFSTGDIFRVNLGHYSHKSGVCFSSNTRLYILDELEFGFLGGKIYSLDLAPALQYAEAHLEPK